MKNPFKTSNSQQKTRLSASFLTEYNTDVLCSDLSMNTISQNTGNVKYVDPTGIEPANSDFSDPNVHQYRAHTALIYHIASILLLLLTSYFLLLTSNALAFDATTSAQVNYQPLDTSTLTPQSPVYANLIVNNLLHAFSCLAAGTSPIGQPCVDYLNGVPVISSANTSGGLLGAVASLNTIVIANPPIRTGQYLATIGDSLGLAKPAHAQVGGSGEGVLRPILTLWQVSRNIAYVFLIIILIVIGLMVMFRTRINPQTIISVQAALPGLIIGLIMITFSYFMASLIIDTAYLATNLVGYYFTAAQGNPNTNLLNDVSGESVLSVFGKLAGTITKEDTTGAVAEVWNGLPDGVARLLTAAAGLLAFQFGSSVGNIGIPFVGPIVGLLTAIPTLVNPQAIIGLVLWVMAVGAILYSMLRLLLRLINSYLSIIFLTVSAPFHFLAASLPGRQSIAVDWIRNMLCNVLAFPAVLAVLYFAVFILGRNVNPFSVSGSVSITGGRTLPLFGGLDLDFIRILLAFGAILATPKIPDIICEAIGKVGRAGAMLEQEISGATQAGRGYAQQAPGLATRPVSSVGESYQSFRGPGAPPASRFARWLPGWLQPRRPLAGAPPPTTP